MNRPLGTMVAAVAVVLVAGAATAETRTLSCRTTREVANISGGHVSFPLTLYVRIDEAANSYAESTRNDAAGANLCETGYICRFDAKVIKVSSASASGEVLTTITRDGWRYKQESQRGNVMSLTYGSCS